MRVVLLDKKHTRDKFDCGHPSLNKYLHTQAIQDDKKGLAKCFVIENDDRKVLGFYTVTSQSMGRDEIPAKYIKKLPQNYNAPVILLGRLAIDNSIKGKGLGGALLSNALIRSYNISQSSIGAMAIVVDPIDEKARMFYSSFGFEDLLDTERMFLPMSTIKKLIFAANERTKSSLTL